MKLKSINLNEHIKHDSWLTFIMALPRSFTILIGGYVSRVRNGFGHLVLIVISTFMSVGILKAGKEIKEYSNFFFCAFVVHSDNMQGMFGDVCVL